MKILLTGAAGQLGWELQRRIPVNVRLTPMTRVELDVGDANQVQKAVRAIDPDWIINASAYTAVDRAESEPEAAFRVNEQGARNLAQAAADNGARLLHVSTDFVFDGEAGAPRRPDDPASPLGVYGESKWRGEQAIRELLGDDALIIRTAWVYSAHGHNFVKTMLRLMNERDEINVVEDQIGTPTWAAELARVVFLAVARDLRGVYHWTDAGVASWYDFAVAIQSLGRQLGLLESDATIRPIPTQAYPLPARRPANSVLDKQALREAVGHTGLHWREALKNMLKELRDV